MDYSKKENVPIFQLFSNDIELKVVQVLVQFCRIGEIDTINEKFQAEVYMECTWLDKELKTDYNPNVHWNPELYIENAINLTEEIKYRVLKINSSSSEITEIRHIKGTFWERLELKNFPVDIQELSVILTTRLGPHEIKLTPDLHRLSFMNLNALNTFIDQQKWKLYKLVKISESASYDRETNMDSINHISTCFIDSHLYRPFKHPKIGATCYCSRKPGYYAMNAYFLIFLITISALTVFAMDCKLPQSRIQTTCTILLTSVSFKWVINRSLPTVSYLTSLDKYSIVGIFYVCMMALWHALVGKFWDREKAEDLDVYMFFAFVGILVLINLGFLIWFVIAYTRISRLEKKEKEFLRKFRDAIKREHLKF